MAGTTIKGVGNGSNVQMPDLTTAAKQNEGTSFQAVWNKTQSSAQTANASTNNRNRTDHSDVRRGDSLKNGDRQRDNLVHASDDKGMDTEKTDAKDLEKAQEVLGTIVQNLIGQITGTFSISEEELQGIMDDLGMTKMDLTDPASLNELLMNISGAQDSFALLTDENLYGNVKGIMNLQNELVGQAQEDLKLAPEEWQQTVAGIAQETVAEPVITVEMDDAVNTAAGSQTGEAAIPMQEPEILENQAAQNTQGEKAGDFGEKQEHAANGEHGNLLTGTPAGLGEPVFDKLSALLAHALMSIGAVKAVEIGDGIAVTSSNGSTDNDGFTVKDGEIIKTSNHAGGIMGGISDGSEIILRAHIKPTPSISQPQQTVTKDKEPLSLEIHGRHDPVIVPRAVVVVESMAAITLADALFVNMSSQMDKVRDFYRK